MNRIIVAAGAVMGCLALPFATQAQSQSPPMGPAGNDAAPADHVVEPAARTNTSTEAFATAAAMTDLFQIEVSKLALSKSSNSDIQLFAHQIIADHASSQQKLKDALKTARQKIKLPTTLDAAHQLKIDSLERLVGRDFDREFVALQRTTHTESATLMRDYDAQGDIPAVRQFAGDQSKIMEGRLAQVQRLPQM